MLYTINNPELFGEWKQINILNINNLLNKYPVHPSMLRNAIEVLEKNTKDDKILNLGGFSLDIQMNENIEEVIQILKNY